MTGLFLSLLNHWDFPHIRKQNQTYSFFLPDHGLVLRQGPGVCFCVPGQLDLTVVIPYTLPDTFLQLWYIRQRFYCHFAVRVRMEKFEKGEIHRILFPGPFQPQRGQIRLNFILRAWSTWKRRWVSPFKTGAVPNFLWEISVPAMTPNIAPQASLCWSRP